MTLKITIYGAAGNVGQAIAAESLKRGHTVVGVGRSATPAAVSSARIADFGDIAALEELDKASDVIVISIPPDRTGASHEPLLAAHRQLIAAHPSSRILVVGGAGALEEGGVLLMDAPDFPDMFKPEAGTMKAVLDLYRDSVEVDWTMIAPPPEISSGTRTGRYVVGTDSPVGASISTEDFALAVVDELEFPHHRGERFTVAH